VETEVIEKGSTGGREKRESRKRKIMHKGNILLTLD